MDMIKLSNGVEMPLEGFGVFQVPDPAKMKNNSNFFCRQKMGIAKLTGE